MTQIMNAHIGKAGGKIKPGIFSGLLAFLPRRKYPVSAPKLLDKATCSFVTAISPIDDTCLFAHPASGRRDPLPPAAN